MADFDVPVLIVGGGPVGLSASLLLSDLGVDSLLVERNPTTTDHPKAHVVNTRTMEIFHGLGVDEAVRAAAIPPRAMGHVRWLTSLAGEELARLDAAFHAGDLSPTLGASCAQDRVEAALVEAAASRRGRLRFGSELASLETDDAGVTATLASGEILRARYAIAADGASSGVRRQLGIAMLGLPELATVIGTYFHADLRRFVEARPALLYWIMNTAAPGTFIALDGAERWVFHLGVPADAPELDAAEIAGILRSAIGNPDVKLDIRSIRPWRMTAQIAERYRHGSVLLAGDAAHRFPPTGGLGMNTGVQDVHNLAWKLALVLAGDAPDALLDSYELERRPVAQTNSDFSVHNAMRGGTAVGPGARAAMVALEGGGADRPAVIAQLKRDVEANREHFGSLALDLGFVYERGALVPEPGERANDSGDATRYRPDALPGARAPHVWLERDGVRVSTLDLFGTDFALLCAGSPACWLEAASRLPGRIRLGVVEIDSGGFYGLEPGGAVLVRPDGHVAWRTRTPVAAPLPALRDALGRVLGLAS